MCPLLGLVGEAPCARLPPDQGGGYLLGAEAESLAGIGVLGLVGEREVFATETVDLAHGVILTFFLALRHLGNLGADGVCWATMLGWWNW